MKRVKSKHLKVSYGAKTIASHHIPLLQSMGVGAALILATGAVYGQDETKVTTKENTEQSAQVDSQPEVKNGGEANVGSVNELGAITVKAPKLKAADKAKFKLDEVAGGTGLVRSEDVERGRVSTAEDVLKFQPGVIAQSAGGNSAIKISIRGSGANASPGYFREGTKFLFDGMALTGPGGTPNELLEMASVDYTEVLRGANAFDYGALSLGGAINFVTKSGRSDPGFTARFDVGSFGWQKQQLSTGGVVGDGDYYVSLTNTRREGYQDWTTVDAQGLVANFGYKINDNLDTRLFVHYVDYFHQSAGALTLKQLKEDSSQTNPSTKLGKASFFKDGSFWLGSKTTYKINDDSKLEFGLVYHDYPQTISKGAPKSGEFSNWDFRDINTTLRYLRSDELFGHKSDTTFSFASTYAVQGGYRTYQGQTEKLRKVGNFGGGYDYVLSAGNELALTDDLRLSTGLSASKVHREFNIPFSDRANTSPYPQKDSYDDWSLAPRVGLRYIVAPEVQVFTNASRTIDPPSDWSYAGSGSATNYVKPLINQVANTIEFGLRGKSGIFDGSVAVYRSWIKNELLTEEIIPAKGAIAAVTSTFNASPTIHQGIEAGLDAQLWHGSNESDKVVLRQVYTFNDFYRRNDKVFGSNELPGLPKHIYKAELQYQNHGGFYAGVDVSLASKTYVDYANSFEVPSYAIYGAKTGYEAPSKQWKVYLDLKNLTDKDYVTALAPQSNAKGKDLAALYPGDGFGAFAGATIKF